MRELVLLQRCFVDTLDLVIAGYSVRVERIGNVRDLGLLERVVLSRPKNNDSDLTTWTFLRRF